MALLLSGSLTRPMGDEVEGSGVVVRGEGQGPRMMVYPRQGGNLGDLAYRLLGDVAGLRRCGSATRQLGDKVVQRQGSLATWLLCNMVARRLGRSASVWLGNSVAPHRGCYGDWRSGARRRGWSAMLWLGDLAAGRHDGSATRWNGIWAGQRGTATWWHCDRAARRPSDSATWWRGGLVAWRLGGSATGLLASRGFCDVVAQRRGGTST